MSRLDEIEHLTTAIRGNYTPRREDVSESLESLVKFAKAVKAATLDRHITYADADELVLAALEELEQDT
jgi:hypothetical protein